MKTRENSGSPSMSLRPHRPYPRLKENFWAMANRPCGPCSESLRHGPEAPSKATPTANSPATAAAT